MRLLTLFVLFVVVVLVVRMLCVSCVCVCSLCVVCCDCSILFLCVLFGLVVARVASSLFCVRVRSCGFVRASCCVRVLVSLC